MSNHCPPENKYPPKPCPCPEIPGPPGPPGPLGLQGPQGDAGPAGASGFEVEITSAPFLDDTTELTALPIGGVGPFAYVWTLASSTYYVNQSPVGSELTLVPGAATPDKQRVSPTILTDGEGVVSVKVTDAGTGLVSIGYHYTKFSPGAP